MGSYRSETPEARGTVSDRFQELHQMTPVRHLRGGTHLPKEAAFKRLPVLEAKKVQLGGEVRLVLGEMVDLYNDLYMFPF